MEDSTNWLLELEEALLDEVPPQQIKVLLAGFNFFLEKCKYFLTCILFLGRPLPASLRTDVWSHCLEINGRKSRIEKVHNFINHSVCNHKHKIRFKLNSKKNYKVYSFFSLTMCMTILTKVKYEELPRSW